jgi:uncharacterized membrane protein YkvA (DUF1232 family)
MGKFKLLLNFIKDIYNGRYKSFSKRLLLFGLIGSFYIVMPADFIPDWIPFAGVIDDVAVFGLIYKQLNKDLVKYRLWKEKSFYL